MEREREREYVSFNVKPAGEPDSVSDDNTPRNYES